MDLPFSQACENNKNPILEILRSTLNKTGKVLEIGAGTGQHAVYFAPALPHLQWQCTDVPEQLDGLRRRINAYPSDNLLPPLPLDLNSPSWPQGFDAIFSANTAHIMPWPLVQKLIEEAGRRLPAQGLMLLYGPFNYGGHYTSESNAAFDQWLKQQGHERGIRDFEALEREALRAGLKLEADHAMPANNRLLIWRK